MGYKIELALCQQVAFTNGGSTASTNGMGRKGVVLYATADCFIKYAASPTAGSTGAANIFVPANTFVELELPQSTYKIAARGVSASGTLYINPLV